MPFVAIHKAAKRNRGKRPGTPEQRRSWAIAAQTEPAFKRAYRKLLSQLITPEMERDIRAALVQTNATVESVMQAIPFFNPDAPETMAVWEKFADQLQGAYETSLQFAAQAEMKRHGWKVPVQKAKTPFIAIDPQAIEWMRKQSLSKVVDMSASEAGRVRAILTSAFEAGEHPTAIMDSITRTVGLTERQAERVARRADAMFDAGLPKADIAAENQRFTQQLRAQRAEAIARTESLDAQTQGLKASWRAAEDNGLMPEGTKKKWSATNDERTSEICEELDGQEVPIGEQFDSSIVGPVDGPPAHPNCRSTMVLEFPKE